MGVPTEKITAERLEKWKVHFAREHATPLVLIGIGHDENSGGLVTCMVEGVPACQLAIILMQVANRTPEP